MLRNKKLFYLLILVIGILMLVPSCGGQESGGSGYGPDSASSESVQLDYRTACGEEGAKLMLSNHEYYDGFSQNDLDFRMQKNGQVLYGIRKHKAL